eukprot:TRINITY_DN37956_c0_g1_i1.p1 TRINITY_DN37956_c0_g1~~TRINITY_DN37956_c0_g1_i1.p1  ORF type:complete len:609 (-),score=126.64 TRINITY_DN37956_c0_g1_i1:127-1953(-)
MSLSDADSKLEAQAQAMAEKALEKVLEKLPAAAKAAKIEKVKDGIVKRLREQAGVPAGAAASTPTAVVPLPALAVPPPPSSGIPPPPPPKAPQSEMPVEKLPGIEMCGDEPWFADPKVRRMLQDKVIAAHAEQKILVGPPAEEMRRICPGNGRVLGAGAVLRLGGSVLGGYGEADIAYAYRQLSRALHPDKNPGIPLAADAFKRLTEAAEELRQGLIEARHLLKTLTEAVGGSVTEEMRERPQEALFAEASRVLSAVLGLAGEGEVPPAALARAAAAADASRRYYGCQAQALVSLWFETSHLLDCFSCVQLRTAYDCSPKHLRAQFLCAVSRVATAEEKRTGGLRGIWQVILMQFPELGLWRDLRDKLRSRVWAAEKTSKWDATSVSMTASSWARPWRDKIREQLSCVGIDEAVTVTSTEVRRLAVDIWKDFVDWGRGEQVHRHLELFTGDASVGASATASEWTFVPASDLFLVLGEGMVGLTAEGIFLEALQGVPQPEKCGKNDDSDKKGKDENGDGKSDDKSIEKKQDPNWEKIWRSKVEVQKWKNHQRGRPGWQRGHSPVRGYSSSSSKDRRRKNKAKGRRRSARSRSRRRNRSRSSSETCSSDK